MASAKTLSQDNYAWYRRYPARALSGMRGLKPEQRGIYGTIIDLCYDRRGPLTDDDVTMARECDCDVRRYRRIKGELLALKRIIVDEEAGTIYDERAVRELVASQMFSESQAKRARRPHKKSTANAKRAVSARAKPEVQQILQDFGQTVGPKSPDRSLKDNEKTGANRKEKKEESSSSDEAQARPPSPLIGGGRAASGRAKPIPIAEDPAEREAAKAAAQKRLREAIDADGAPP